MDQQRRVTSQLNIGKTLHVLRQFLFFANEEAIRLSQIEDQANQAVSFTLLTNGIILWNAIYIEEFVNDLKKIVMKEISDEDIKHISPCRFKRINKYGKF